jgi:hypothetical protein
LAERRTINRQPRKHCALRTGAETKDKEDSETKALASQDSDFTSLSVLTCYERLCGRHAALSQLSSVHEEPRIAQTAERRNYLKIFLLLQRQAIAELKDRLNVNFVT